MKHSFLIILIAVLLSSCSRGFDPIAYGSDACAHCKMTIVDNRYASELLTSKGRAYKFDDILCMKKFAEEQKVEGTNSFFVSNFLKPGEPIAADQALYLKHDFFETPMNGHYAAFISKTEATKLADSLGIQLVDWKSVN